MQKNNCKLIHANLKTPILFLIFNRPDTTQQVFNLIKKIKPSKLYVAADGAREEREGEKEKCLQTRDIIKQIDWKCEIKTLFRDQNLGCKIAVSSAIDWFFENEERGIIIEDDCLPDLSFFPFCEQLLDYYKDDPGISMISGDNFQFGWNNSKDSYYFSKYCHIWGWATWRRVWQQYDVLMKSFPDFVKDKNMELLFSEKSVQLYWVDIMSSVYRGEVDTWDYQWVYSIWAQNGLCILPNVNLISNIGCGAGTHVGKGAKKSRVSNMPTENISFPLVHPKKVKQNVEADERYSANFARINKFTRTLAKVKKYIQDLCF